MLVFGLTHTCYRIFFYGYMYMTVVVLSHLIAGGGAEGQSSSFLFRNMSRPIWSTRDRRKLWGEEEDDDDEPEGQGTGGGAEEEEVVPAASFLGSIPPLAGGWMLRRSDTRVTTSDMCCFRHPAVGGIVLVQDEIELSINRLGTLFLNNNRNVLQCTILRKSQIECKQFGSKYNQRKLSENTECTSSLADYSSKLTLG